MLRGVNANDEDDDSSIVITIKNLIKTRRTDEAIPSNTDDLDDLISDLVHKSFLQQDIFVL